MKILLGLEVLGLILLVVAAGCLLGYKTAEHVSGMLSPRALVMEAGSR